MRDGEHSPSLIALRIAADVAAVRQSVMDDYKASYGAMLDAVNRTAAGQAGTTDGQAREVIAATLPAVSQVLSEANGERGEQGLARRLGDLQA